MKNKLTAKEKEAIAASAFKDAPDEEVLYVSDSGTVLNKKEYEARANKQGCDPFEHKVEKEAAAPAGDPEAAAKLEAAEKEIERLNELKSVKDAKAKLAAKDAEIAELKKQIEELTPKD